MANVPLNVNPKRVIWQKILQKEQANAGGNAKTRNNPLPGNTTRELKVKVLRSIIGI